MANENNLTVVLDVTLDRDLMLEGLARELIRSAQVMRKSANFNVEDRIDIEFTTASEDLNEIISKFGDKIKSELLARSFNRRKRFRSDRLCYRRRSYLELLLIMKGGI